MIATPGLLKTLINGVLGLAGVRLVRNSPPPLSADDAGLRGILEQLGISVVFDVGASVGQYGTRLRNIGYRGRIVSFEPQATAFSILSERTMLDTQWMAVCLALGDRETEEDLNISENSWSSSFLSVSTDILEVEPRIAAKGTEKVLIKTLDQIWTEFVGPSDNVFLKLDVQGYEPQILAGAQTSLSCCKAVQMEMALFQSYLGQKSLSEMMEIMSKRDFKLVHLERGFWDARTGYLIEVDGIFVRSEPGSAVGRLFSSP